MRSVRRLLAVLVLLVAILVVGGFWAGERWGRPAAERAVAAEVQARYGLEEPPDVHLFGKPFAWRAARGHLDGATAQLAHVEAAGVSFSPVVLRLTDIRFSTRDALAASGSPNPKAAVRMGTAIVEATLSERELSRYLMDHGLAATVTVTPDGIGLHGRVELLGVAAEVAGRGTLVVNAGQLELRPTDVSAVTPGVSPLVLQQVRNLFTLTIDIPDLVPGVRPTALRFGVGNATLTADVSDLLKS